MTASTTIINIYAGPGAGKSTTAASVFAVMKTVGYSVELITEWVKEQCWRGEPIDDFEDLYITTSQLRRESACYGKVEYIVTDSPIGLGAVFERMHPKPGDRHPMLDMVREIEKRQDYAGIKRVNCLLKRSKPFQQAGRYHTEEQSRQVDRHCEEFLRMNASRPFHFVTDTQDVMRAAGLL